MTATSPAAVRAPAGAVIARAIVAAAVAFAIVRHAARPVVPDVGWLSQMAMEMLDGARLYVDIADTNPPMSVLLYLPVAVLHRAIGGPFGLALLLPMLALWAAATAGAVRLGRGGRSDPDHSPPAVLWAASALAFLVLSAGVFGQREHGAAMLLLPYLAAIARRAEGGRPSWRAVVGVGLAAGLAVTIKPQFAAAVALPALVAAVSARRVRLLLAPEALIAAIVLLAYGAATVVLFSAFGAVWLPILFDTYRAVRLPLADLLASPAVTAAAFAVAAAALTAATAGGRDRLPATLAAAALGFWIAAIEQGKGWSNHLYPATALAAVALAVVAATERSAVRRLTAALALATVAMMTMPAALQRPQDTMDSAETLRREAPPRPRLLVLSGAVGAGNPLAVEIGARWVGTSVGTWVSDFARHRLATERLDAATTARLALLDEADRARFRDDLLTGDPDVILIDRGSEDWLAWAQRDPAIAAALGGYEKRGEAVSVEVWIKRTP